MSRICLPAGGADAAHEGTTKTVDVGSWQCAACRVCMCMPAGGADAAHEGTTKTGAPKEHFGSGHDARVEAGKKGGHISVRPRALQDRVLYSMW